LTAGVSPLIDLSLDRLALHSPAEVREAAKAALDRGATHYTESAGLRCLREAIALRLAAVNGIAVSPTEEVLVTCGTQESLFLAVRSLVGPGDSVIVPGPALPADLELIAAVGARASVAEPGEGLGLDPEAVRALVTPRARALLLRCPSPVGAIPDERELERLGAIAVIHGLTVIAVESDEALVASGATHRSIGAVGGLGPRTVTINDFAAVGLDGWRVGYLAAQSRLMDPMRRLKHELSICSPAVSQHAAAGAMARLEAYTAATRDRLDLRRAALAGALARAGVDAVVPEAGPYVMVRLADGVAAAEVVARARAAGVAIADGRRVGSPGWLRLTLDEEPDRLAAAAGRLGEVLGGPQPGGVR
jgi:aminotransferase